MKYGIIPARDRYVCKKEAPWSEDKGMAVHPDAKHLYDEYGSLAQGGSYERYECPHCKLRFWVTLPD